MESKKRKTLTGIIVFLMFVELTSATGYLRSQNGSIVLQPADGQVLPNVDNNYNFGSPSNHWANLYANSLVSNPATGKAGLNITYSSAGNGDYIAIISPTALGSNYNIGLLKLYAHGDSDGSGTPIQLISSAYATSAGRDSLRIHNLADNTDAYGIRIVQENDAGSALRVEESSSTTAMMTAQEFH